MAAAGFGAYALIVPPMLVPVFYSWDLFVTYRWRPTWSWSWVRFKPAWHFGSARILGMTFVSAASLLESSWLVRAVGFATLGLFGRAIGLSHLLCGRVASLLSVSVYPVLTRIQPRTDAFRRASAMYIRTIAWLVLPAAGLAGLLASPIVRVLYGGQWIEVIPLLPWAMAAGALAAVVQTVYTVLLAHGRQDRCLLADVWRLTGTALALVLLVPFGLGSYLAGLVLLHLLSLILLLRWLHNDGALTVEGLTRAFVPPGVAATTAMCFVGIARWSAGADASSCWAAVGHAIIFGVVYLAILRACFRAELSELVGYLPIQRRLGRLLWLPQAA
jgi:O-antigen/teichoic acid export membrane protein